MYHRLRLGQFVVRIGIGFNIFYCILNHIKMTIIIKQTYIANGSSHKFFNLITTLPSGKSKIDC